MQLIRGWHHLRDLLSEHVRNSVTRGSVTKEEGDRLMADFADRLMADFADREARLQSLLSCACSGPCGDRCKTALVKDQRRLIVNAALGVTKRTERREKGDLKWFNSLVGRNTARSTQLFMRAIPRQSARQSPRNAWVLAPLRG